MVLDVAPDVVFADDCWCGTLRPAADCCASECECRLVQCVLWSVEGAGTSKSPKRASFLRFFLANQKNHIRGFMVVLAAPRFEGTGWGSGICGASLVLFCRLYLTAITWCVSGFSGADGNKRLLTQKNHPRIPSEGMVWIC